MQTWLNKFFQRIFGVSAQIDDLASKLLEAQRQSETFRHAYETTMEDRDRLSALLKAKDGSGVVLPDFEVDEEPEVSTSEEKELYGRYWSQPSRVHKTIIGDRPLDAGLFKSLMDTGFVSQYSVFRNRAHVRQLISWQVQNLEDSGLGLGGLSDEFEELPIIPEHMLFEIDGRRISTDFLRHLEYLNLISTNLTLSETPVIVEIGSGYGGLSRLLKIKYPQAKIVLIDIPETLRMAEFYLKSSFPECTFTHPTEPGTTVQDIDADFIICDVDQADFLENNDFNLVVNTWSFGEMPNQFINKWFCFIQDRNITRNFFFLNHFMMPLCLESSILSDQLNDSNWLSRIDGRWQIKVFEINPGVHRSPIWRHCQQGLGIFGSLFNNEKDRGVSKRLAHLAAQAVYQEDWAFLSVAPEGDVDASAQDKRRNLISSSEPKIDASTVFDMSQVDLILGICKDDARTGKDSAFFKLWNDFRLNGSRASLRLLRILIFLHWRPAQRNPDTGAPYTVISGEDFFFGIMANGYWTDDPCLRVPHWLNDRLGQIPVRN